MILRIQKRNHSRDSKKIAQLIATGSATCPVRLAQQFAAEYLTSPSGVRYQVEIPRRHTGWLAFHVINFVGFAIEPHPGYDYRSGTMWFTSEAVKCGVESSLLRDLSFVEELNRRHGRPSKRVLRRDIRPFVKPAIMVLRRLVEADFIPGCPCSSCRKAVTQ